MIAAFHRLFVAGLAIALACVPQSVLACAACFGKSDDAMAQGMNMGIFTLLIVIVSVLGGIASVAVFLVRRAAHYSANAASREPSPSSQSISQSTQ